MALKNIIENQPIKKIAKGGAAGGLILAVGLFFFGNRNIRGVTYVGEKYDNTMSTSYLPQKNQRKVYEFKKGNQVYTFGKRKNVELELFKPYDLKTGITGPKDGIIREANPLN